MGVVKFPERRADRPGANVNVVTARMQEDFETVLRHDPSLAQAIARRTHEAAGSIRAAASCRESVILTARGQQIRRHKQELLTAIANRIRDAHQRDLVRRWNVWAGQFTLPVPLTLPIAHHEPPRPDPRHDDAATRARNRDGGPARVRSATAR